MGQKLGVVCALFSVLQLASFSISRGGKASPYQCGPRTDWSLLGVGAAHQATVRYPVFGRIFGS